MSVTRAFIITCSKSALGNEFFNRVLTRSGFKMAFPRGKAKFGLEVPGGGDPSAFKDFEKVVLCISPDGKVAPNDFLAELFQLPLDLLKKRFSRIVEINSIPDDLGRLKKALDESFPRISKVLKDSPEIQSILSSAWWDIWRLLYAGARVDAIAQDEKAICLIEAKIWGKVYEIQARNHAKDFFGSTQIPIIGISWQSIYEEASCFREDPIISDFIEYLEEFPQLVRWNGFDSLDLRAFKMNSADLATEPFLLGRLKSHYWQCMEELCSNFSYTPIKKRGDDWDFVPSKKKNFLGNAGIGIWDTGSLNAKWCVGYYAWEMDRLTNRLDLFQRGETACANLAAFLKSDPKFGSFWVEMRAVQRFQYISAMDGTWFEGSSIQIRESEDLESTLKSFWKKEFELLRNIHKKRGEKVTSKKALEIKQEHFRMRNPDVKEFPEHVKKMATKHETFFLYAAFDIFVHIAPQFFSEESGSKFMAKDKQLVELERVVGGLVRFAETLSG